MTGAARRRRAR
ncbi:hypothetical protein SM139_1962, partial [Stenotrophomonas maltophilia]